MPKNSRFSRISKFIVLPLIPTGFYSNIARVRKRRRTQRGKDLACQSSKIDHQHLAKSAFSRIVLRIALRGFSGVSAIGSVRVAANAYLFFVAAAVSGVGGVSAGGFVPAVPCSNEHIHGNSVVKAFLSESRGTRALVNVRLCSGKFARGTPAATIKPVRVVSSVVEHLVYTEKSAVLRFPRSARENAVFIGETD